MRYDRMLARNCNTSLLWRDEFATFAGLFTMLRFEVQLMPCYGTVGSSQPDCLFHLRLSPLLREIRMYNCVLSSSPSEAYASRMPSMHRTSIDDGILKVGRLI